MRKIKTKATAFLGNWGLRALCLVIPITAGLVVQELPVSTSVNQEAVRAHFEIRGRKAAPQGVVMVTEDETYTFVDPLFSLPLEHSFDSGLGSVPDSRVSRLQFGDALLRVEAAGARAVVLNYSGDPIIGYQDCEQISFQTCRNNSRNDSMRKAYNRLARRIVFPSECRSLDRLGNGWIQFGIGPEDLKGNDSFRASDGNGRKEINRIPLEKLGPGLPTACATSSTIAFQVPLSLTLHSFGLPKSREITVSLYGIAAALAKVGHYPVRPEAYTSTSSSPGKWAWIDYAGPAGTVPQLPLIDVAGAQGIRISKRELRNKVAGKVVIFGPTWRERNNGYGVDPSLVVASPGPGGGWMYRTEMLANAIATMQAGYPLRDAPNLAVFLLIFVFAVAAPLAAIRFRLTVWLVAWVLVVASWIVFTQFAFNQGVVLPVLAPSVALLLSAVSAGILTNRRTLRALRSRFAEGDEAALRAVIGETVAPGKSAELVVPGYSIDSLIGRGGSGLVYRATNLANGETVALKVLRPDIAGNRRGRQQLLREIEVARRFRHPNVLPVLDYGDIDELMFMTTRFMADGDASQLLAGREGGVTQAELLAIVNGVGSALEDAHAAGLLHRDVKPSNIYLQDGVAFLSDFGIARVSGDTTEDGLSAGSGTLIYGSPEQLGLTSHEVTKATDIYAFAASLVLLAAGHPPFPQETAAQIVAAKLTNPDLGGLADGLRDVLGRAMALDPSDRPASVAEMRDGIVGGQG